MGRVLRGLGLSRHKVQPSHPMQDPAAAAAFKKSPANRESNASGRIKTSACACIFKTKRASDRKGRDCHVGWKRGERPPGLCDQRYLNTSIDAAVEPGTGNACAPILPDANAARMQAFLDAFADTIASHEHVALVGDGAGWHRAKTLRVPPNITLVPLPASSPGLNLVERVWPVEQRFLPMRRLNDDKAIVTAASNAWRRLRREAGRLASLTHTPGS